MTELKDRFLKYVSFDTQSDPESNTFPSTEKQWVLLRYLKEELEQIGLSDVQIDEYGYVMATLPATPGYEQKPAIGFISHVDTSPDMSGKGVKPQILENYQGGDIKLNADITMKVEDFPELEKLIGHTIIHTDGTTLLGADDKAGVAEIVTAVDWLINHPEVAHGPIKVGFTPDEEIGHGVDHFDVKRFGAKFAYTMDGGYEGELEYENFNAAGVKLHIQGRNIHPGSAKNKMINALQVAMDLHQLLPTDQRPEHTEHYEGFFHLIGLSGAVEEATMQYIIRDHDRKLFEQKKEIMTAAVAYINRKYGRDIVKLEMNDQYYNMREMVEPHPELINKAISAMEAIDVKPWIKPIRGGTDGSRLSYMGLPCPNLFTGGANFHGKFEYASYTTMQKSVKLIIELAKRWAE